MFLSTARLWVGGIQWSERVNSEEAIRHIHEARGTEIVKEENSNIERLAVNAAVASRKSPAEPIIVDIRR